MSDDVKIREIMARFRPHRAEAPFASGHRRPTGDQPALYLQSKRCQIRKRSRGSSASSTMSPPRRQRGFLSVLPPPDAQLAFQQIVPVPFPSLQEQNLTLSLLQSSPEIAVPTFSVEKGLPQKLWENRSIGSSIRVKPIEAVPITALPPARVISSSIRVEPIEAVPITALPPVSKKPEEIEEEMESERLPTVISDSKNRVRLANAAYNEMVGQPECPWLESLISPSLKRLTGEVKLVLSDAAPAPPACWKGFSCMVKIEWMNN